MSDENTNPFYPGIPPNATDEPLAFPPTEFQAHAPDPLPPDLGSVLGSVLFVVVASFLNWHVSPILGLGAPYTLFFHLPFVSLGVGFLAGLMNRRILLFQPFIFFFVAYVMHAGFIGIFESKFFWLYWELGAASFLSMLFGCCIGGLLKIGISALDARRKRAD